jgi:hypothetical protein
MHEQSPVRPWEQKPLKRLKTRALLCVTLSSTLRNAGDEEVRDLIFECLETIRDPLRTSDQLGLVSGHFGPKCRDLWERLRHV